MIQIKIPLKCLCVYVYRICSLIDVDFNGKHANKLKELLMINFP